MRSLPVLFGILALVATQPATAQIGFGGLGGFGSGIGTGIAGAASPTDTPQFGFAPFVTVQGFYSRIVGPTSLSFQNRQDSYGAFASAGIGGGKRWAHTAIALGYVGNVTYNPYFYSGSRWLQNHSGYFSVSHAVTDRLSVFVSQIAGTALGGSSSYYGLGSLGLLGGFGGLGGYDYSGATSFLSPGNYLQNGLVDSELVSQRVNYYASSGGLSYRMSERWFVSAGGGAAFVRREGSLFGGDSQQASGQIGYIINPSSEIGLSYSHFWNQVTGQFGGVEGQALNLGYSRRLSRRSYIGVGGGAVEVRSGFVGLVPVPEQIALVTGQTAAFEVQKVHYYSAGFGGSYSQNFQTSSLNIFANRGFSPGNGVVLAGVRDIVGINYSMFQNRKVGLNASAVGTRYTSSLGGIQRSYTYAGTLSTGYRLFKQVEFTTSAGYQETQIPHLLHLRGLVVSAGLGWTPREFVLAF